MTYAATWTQEEIAVLRQLWGDGHSARYIAARIRTHNRNAIIGKAHRLKLASRPSPLRRAPQKDGGCRFPMWPHDAQPTGEFCGQQIARRSYCAEHYALTHTTSRAPFEVAA